MQEGPPTPELAAERREMTLITTMPADGEPRSGLAGVEPAVASLEPPEDAVADGPEPDEAAVPRMPMEAIAARLPDVTPVAV